MCTCCGMCGWRTWDYDYVQDVNSDRCTSTRRKKKSYRITELQKACSLYHRGNLELKFDVVVDEPAKVIK